MNQFNNMNQILNNNYMNPNFNHLNQNINFNYQMNLNMNMINQIQYINMMMPQMNQMILSLQKQQQKNYIDIFPYIKEDKKEIIFITSDNKLEYIKIPKSLRKNELYYSANRFKNFKYSDIKLFHKNNLLENDDSSIDNISINDSIKIVEELDVDLSYYNSLLEKYKN